MAHKLLKNHQEIPLAKQNVTADTVDEVVYALEERRKIELFKTLLEEQYWDQVLVFTSTKDQADIIVQLEEKGYATQGAKFEIKLTAGK